MYELNEKIRDLVPYEPINGDYKIRLDANESFLPVPEYIMKEVIASELSLQFNRYPDAVAEKLCAAFSSAYGLDPVNVAAGNGSDELISVIFGGFLMRGEAFATVSQDFSMYDFYGSLSEGRAVKIQKEADFTLDVDKVIKTCNDENVRLLIFSNPCNPTSLGLDREKIRKLIKGVNGLVILDEAYMDFWDQSMLSEVLNYDNLLILKTCSKAFGLAALRLGFAVGNEKLVRAIKAIKSPYNVNSFSQMMGTVLLSHKAETAAALKQIVASRKELEEMLLKLSEEFPGKLSIIPGCTNFVTVITEDKEEIFSYLLKLGIAIRKFPEFLRITAGSHSENCETVRFIGNFFREGK